MKLLTAIIHTRYIFILFVSAEMKKDSFSIEC